MKKLIAGVMACMCLLTTSVFAQGSAGSAQDWEGGYWGFSVGYLHGEPNHSWSGNPIGVDVDVNGAVFGLTYGRNYTTNSIVYGFETDLNFSNADGFSLGVATPCITPGEACSNELDAYATFRARVGQALQNGWLPYVTFGFAAGKVFATGDTGACAGTPCSLDEIRLGWTAGVGVEKMMNNGWSLKADYSYLDFGSEALDDSSPAFGVVTADFKYNVLKVGLNRSF